MKTKVTLIVSALAIAGLAHAAATPEEAARLGKDFTPWGAEMAGNKEGTIPPYTGGMPTDLMGAKFDSNKNIVDGRTTLPDPYKDEKPVYRITAANVGQYADKLSDTQKALFKRNPAFYMDVYPSHRVANPPKYYSDSSIKNATRCRTEQGGDALKGCKGGTPFPFPKTGHEVMWNLIVGNYQGAFFDFDSPSMYVDRNGTVTLSAGNYVYQHYPYQDSRYSLEDYEGNKPYSNIYQRYAFDRRAPARISGEAQLVTIFTNNSPVAGWAYQPGNRRVRVNPNVSYDYPISAAGGAAFYDEANLYLGRLDRFDWKLLGKKEMLVLYNNYKLVYGKAADVLMPGQPKPEAMRWELHRVWVVEGTRKAGARHAFSKRRYYIDEDMALGSMSDQYDDSGKLVRGGFINGVWVWDYQQSFQYWMNIDIVSGVYYIQDQMGEAQFGGNKYRKFETGIGGFNNGPMWPDSAYTPEALSRRTQK